MLSNDAAKLITIHPNTVRLWTTKYKEFFSPGGQGGSGTQRSLTDDDVRVLTYINSLKTIGRINDEVIIALREAQRRGFHNLPMPMQSEAVAPTRMIPMRAADEAVYAERRIIAILEERIEELKSDLSKMDTDRNTLHEKLERALAEKAAVERELQLYVSGRLTPPTNP